MDIKTRLKPNGIIEKFKAWVVAKRYKKRNIYRVLLVLDFIHKLWKLLIHQMDVKTMVSNNELKEEIYMN